MPSPVKFGFTLAITLLAFTSISEANSLNYVTVDLSSIENNTFSNLKFPNGIPAGLTTLGGVPFDIGTGGWFAEDAAHGTDAPTGVTIFTNVYGATSVDTLFNLYWGTPGPTSYLSVIFVGSQGALYTKDLYAGSDVRDFNNVNYADTIRGNTVNVWNNMGTTGDVWQRIDMQTISLPTPFLTQTLQSITIVDRGGNGLQRSFLTGLTIDPVGDPEPATIFLFASGLMPVWWYSRRRRKA